MVILYCLENDGKEKSVHVQYRHNHPFFSKYFSFKVESTCAEPTDTEGHLYKVSSQSKLLQECGNAIFGRNSLSVL